MSDCIFVPLKVCFLLVLLLACFVHTKSEMWLLVNTIFGWFVGITLKKKNPTECISPNKKGYTERFFVCFENGFQLKYFD